MRVLAIDIGSSSVKAAVLTGVGVPNVVARMSFKTRHSGGEVDVDIKDIERALYAAVGELNCKQVDVIVPTGMAPSWLAMDANGRAITRVVTHQDRRSVEQAQQIETQLGRAKHLKLVGNRPVPGGISSTTHAWFNARQKSLMKRADLAGHLNTWLVRNWCGADARFADYSNASFSGFYRTCKLDDYDDALLEAAGVKRAVLPEVVPANRVVGMCNAMSARALGVREGTPVLAGIMDGSCAMLLAGAEAGRVVNVVGSTDVLALCVDRAIPNEAWLTRALGVGRKWVAVATISAAGSAIDWAHRTLFAEVPVEVFHKRVATIARKLKHANENAVRFDTRLAGERTSIEALRGSITGLSLSTTRDDILAAMLTDLSAQSAARIRQWEKMGLTLNRTVLTTGGDAQVARAMRRAWNGQWKFVNQNHATLRGLWNLAQSAI